MAIMIFLIKCQHAKLENKSSQSEVIIHEKNDIVSRSVNRMYMSCYASF